MITITLRIASSVVDIVNPTIFTDAIEAAVERAFISLRIPPHKTNVIWEDVAPPSDKVVTQIECRGLCNSEALYEVCYSLHSTIVQACRCCLEVTQVETFLAQLRNSPLITEVTGTRCLQCSGRGRVGSLPCFACSGTGRANAQKLWGRPYDHTASAS